VCTIKEEIRTNRGLTPVPNIADMELGRDYEWVCVCTECHKIALWYLTLTDEWKWYCPDITCSNDEHASYENDKDFTVLAVLCSEVHLLESG